MLTRVLPPSAHPIDLTEPLVRFWPSFPSGTEPDLVVTVGGWMVVIEAKYESPFSTGANDSDHQLVREWVDAYPLARVQQLHGPIVLAVTADPAQPADITMARDCVSELADFPAADIDPSHAVQWMSWQQIAAVVESCHATLAPHEQTLVEDLFDFMERRGVRRMATGVYKGDGVYNTTGAGQTRSGSATPTHTVTYTVSVQNDALFADTLRVRGTASTTRFAVKYTAGGIDITSQVTAGTYTAPTLAPGATHTIKVIVTVRSAASAGSSLAATLTTKSNTDPTRRDTVRFVTSRS